MYSPIEKEIKEKWRRQFKENIIESQEKAEREVYIILILEI